MVRSRLFQSQAPSHPDPIRIAAISAAIAANIALLALLVRPPEFTLPTVTDTNPTVTFVTPEPKKIDPPKPPPVVKVVDHKPPPVVQRTPVPPIPHPPVPPVTTDNATGMSTPVPPFVDTTIGQTTIAPQQAIEQALNAIASPAPAYPRIALRDGITGTVELQLLVGVDGRVVKVDIVHSSGNRELDRAAIDQVLRNWRFQPAMRDGVAVQALGRVPIVFSLDGR